MPEQWWAGFTAGAYAGLMVFYTLFLLGDWWERRRVRKALRELDERREAERRARSRALEDGAA